MLGTACAAALIPCLGMVSMRLSSPLTLSTGEVLKATKLVTSRAARDYCLYTSKAFREYRSKGPRRFAEPDRGWRIAIEAFSDDGATLASLPRIIISKYAARGRVRLYVMYISKVLRVVPLRIYHRVAINDGRGLPHSNAELPMASSWTSCTQFVAHPRGYGVLAQSDWRRAAIRCPTS